MHKTPEYQTWADMCSRCRNPRHKLWHVYGGRGITVCDRWLGENGFQNFFEDMGPRPAKLSLDRINNDGNYEPANCRWATNVQQANNTSLVHYLTFNGETMTITEWARQTGLGVPTIFTRRRLGWPVEKILTTPTALHSLNITYEGQTHSRSEWARRGGISPQVLEGRLERGLSMSEALTTPTRRTLTYQGQTLTTKEWKTVTGIPQRVINDRRRAGWSVEQTLTTPVDKRVVPGKKRSPPRDHRKGD